MDFRDRYCSTKKQLDIHNMIVEIIKNSQNKSLFYVSKRLPLVSNRKSLILALKHIYELPAEVVEPVVNRSYRLQKKKRKRFKRY